MRISDWSSDVCSSDLREDKNCCEHARPGQSGKGVDGGKVAGSERDPWRGMNGGGDNQEVEECGNAHGGDAYTDHHFLRSRLRALLDRVQDALEAVEDYGGRSKHTRSAYKPGYAITRVTERVHSMRSEENKSELTTIMRK